MRLFAIDPLLRGVSDEVRLDWRPVNSEADLESDDRHLLEALQDGPSPQAGEIKIICVWLLS